MQNSLAKKAFAVGSAVAMTLVSLAPFAAHAAAHAAGTNVSSSDGTVWMVMPDGTRRAYTSAGAFLSYGFNSFSSVVAANADDLALPAGSFIPPQDGSIICSDRGSDKGTCYEVSGGQKFGFTSAAVFTGLGFSFANSAFGDVSWMSMNSTLLNSTTQVHLPGTLVNNNGTVQLVGNSGLLGIPDLATFNSWGYSFGKVVPANAADKAWSQTGVMAARTPGQLSPTAVIPCTSNCNPQNPPPVTSGPISASLAYDNPTAGTVVAGQATADLGHFTFTGSGSVSQLVFQRTGVSANTSVNNVYLYSGSKRLTDAASVNTNGVITFNNLNWSVNGSATVAVKADIASAATSGQTIGVALTSFTPTGLTAMSANLSGNLFTITSGVGILSTVNLSGTLTPSASTVNAGSTSYTFWSIPVQVSTHAVWLKGINFQVIGSAPTDALSNIQLHVNGSPVGSPSTVGSNGYVFFDLSGNPVSLPTGSTTVEVRANIQKGSNRTVQFAVQNAADFTVTDSQLNVNVAPCTSGCSGTAVFSPLSAGVITISSGTLNTVIDPSFQALTNVTGGGTNTIIGKFKMHAYGEDVKVMTLVVTPSFSVAPTLASGSCTNGTNCSLANVALFFNGSQVGSQQNWTGTGSLTFNLGSSMIAPAGQDSILEVHTDVQNTSSVNYTAGTLVTTLNFSSSTAQGLNSLNTTGVFSGSSLATSGLTIQTGTLSVGKSSYSNQTLNPNQSNQKLGEFTFQNQSTSESVRVTNLAVALTSDGTTALSGSNLTNLSNLKTDETSGNANQPINPSASNNFSTNFTLGPGQSKTIGVWGDLSTLTTGTIVVTVLPTAYGASSNVSLTPATATKGQTINLAAGTFGTPTFQNSASQATTTIAAAGGAVDASHNVFNFTATNGVATVSELKFVVKDNATGSVTSVKVGGVSAPVVTPPATTLSALIGGAASTTISVTSATNITAGSLITVASTTAEDMLVTAVSGTTLTVVRGVNGTSGTNFNNGAAVTIAGMAYLTGLSIAVPNGAGGIYVDAVPTYSSVGTNGVGSGATSQVELTYEKHTIGGTTATNVIGPVRANLMTLTGSVPSLTVAQPTAKVAVANVEAIDVTVAANTKGDVTLVTLPITVGLNGATTSSASTSNIQVYTSTDSTTNLAASNTAFGSTAGGTSTITFTNGGYRIPGGPNATPVTFRIYVTIAAVTGSGVNSASMATSLATGSGFTWIDTAGGSLAVTSATTGTIGITYPNTFTSIIYN